MEKETSRELRLGIFITTGIILLVASLYFIGRNQNLFGQTIRLVAYFSNVNGLQPGNNVRFAGADVGTVESVEVISDTSVMVVLLLKDQYRLFIKNDALASIGTDGLMGNKLINISNRPFSTGGLVSDGNTIHTIRPVETDEMLRTLNQTNDFVSGIAFNLKNITDKIGDSRGTLWKILTDTVLSNRVDSTFIYFQQAGKNITDASSTLNLIVENVNKDKGMFWTLTQDTAVVLQLHNLIRSLNAAGTQSDLVSEKLLTMVKEVEQGKGTLGLIMQDTSISGDLKVAIENLKQSSESLMISMEAMKKIPLLRKYIREAEKSKKP